MDKKTEKTINVIIISLVVLLFLLIFNVYFDKTKDHYIWEGPAGDFKFNVDRTHKDVYHLLKLTDINGDIYNTPFDYGPKDLKYISYDAGINDLLNKNIMYITLIPEEVAATNGKTAIASYTIWRMINKQVEPFIYTIPKSTVTEIYEGYNEDLPIITCNDVSETQGVVLLKQGFSNSMYLEDDCIVLEFVEGDSVKVATAFVYRALGVL